MWERRDSKKLLAEAHYFFFFEKLDAALLMRVTGMFSGGYGRSLEEAAELQVRRGIAAKQYRISLKSCRRSHNPAVDDGQKNSASKNDKYPKETSVSKR